MLLFEDDLQARTLQTAKFLKAQALLGLGEAVAAKELLTEILRCDPNHALAGELYDQLTNPPSSLTAPG